MLLLLLLRWHGGPSVLHKNKNRACMMGSLCSGMRKTPRRAQARVYDLRAGDAVDDHGVDTILQLSARYFIRAKRHDRRKHTVVMHQIVSDPENAVMDLLDASDHVVKLPLQRRYRYLAHLAEALALLHAMNMVHGDIKPDNVLIDVSCADVLPRLIDFGHARRRTDDKLVLLWHANASAPYRAPTTELKPPNNLAAMFRKQRADDVWALALVFDFILWGHCLVAADLTDHLRRYSGLSHARLYSEAVDPRMYSVLDGMTRLDYRARLEVHVVARLLHDITGGF